MGTGIHNHWVVHPLSDSPISIRALKPVGSQRNLFPVNRTYRAADYGSIQALKKAFESDALSLNDQGYNVYTVMNRIRDDFCGHQAVRDKDITHRTTILIDIDRIGDTRNPASEPEVSAATTLAYQVAEYLDLKGFPKPSFVHSGNGCHVYYKVEQKGHEVVGDAVELFLKGLAERFNNEMVGIDTGVFNPSRITKVIGTMSRKGVASEDRPYRIARLL